MLVIIISESAQDAELKIVYQSPIDIVVEDLKKPIPLVCISSFHGDNRSKYFWEKLGEPTVTFPNSPAVYINEIGLYKCHVSFEAQRLSSRIICVSLSKGMWTLT